MKSKFEEYIEATVEQLPDDNEANAPTPARWPWKESDPDLQRQRAGRHDWPDGVGR